MAESTRRDERGISVETNDVSLARAVTSLWLGDRASRGVGKDSAMQSGTKLTLDPVAHMSGKHARHKGSRGTALRNIMTSALKAPVTLMGGVARAVAVEAVDWSSGLVADGEDVLAHFVGLALIATARVVGLWANSAVRAIPASSACGIAHAGDAGVGKIAHRVVCSENTVANTVASVVAALCSRSRARHSRRKRSIDAVTNEAVVDIRDALCVPALAKRGTQKIIIGHSAVIADDHDNGTLVLGRGNAGVDARVVDADVSRRTLGILHALDLFVVEGALSHTELGKLHGPGVVRGRSDPRGCRVETSDVGAVIANQVLCKVVRGAVFGDHKDVVAVLHHTRACERRADGAQRDSASVDRNLEVLGQDIGKGRQTVVGLLEDLQREVIPVRDRATDLTGSAVRRVDDRQDEIVVRHVGDDVEALGTHDALEHVVGDVEHLADGNRVASVGTVLVIATAGRVLEITGNGCAQHVVDNLGNGDVSAARLGLVEEDAHKVHFGSGVEQVAVVRRVQVAIVRVVPSIRSGSGVRANKRRPRGGGVAWHVGPRGAPPRGRVRLHPAVDVRDLKAAARGLCKKQRGSRQHFKRHISDDLRAVHIELGLARHAAEAVVVDFGDLHKRRTRNARVVDRADDGLVQTDVDHTICGIGRVSMHVDDLLGAILDTLDIQGQVVLVVLFGDSKQTSVEVGRRAKESHSSDGGHLRFEEREREVVHGQGSREVPLVGDVLLQADQRRDVISDNSAQYGLATGAGELASGGVGARRKRVGAGDRDVVAEHKHRR